VGSFTTLFRRHMGMSPTTFRGRSLWSAEAKLPLWSGRGDWVHPSEPRHPHPTAEAALPHCKGTSLPHSKDFARFEKHRPPRLE
jgi:hypothetical protein